MVMILSLIEL